MVKKTYVQAFKDGIPFNAEKKKVDRELPRISGYDLVKRFGTSETARAWKEAYKQGLTKESISYKSIYNILEARPTEPKREPIPVYISELEQSEGYLKLKEKYHFSSAIKGHLDERQWERFDKDIKEAFAIVRKDPSNWSREDYKLLWERYRDPKIETIQYRRGTSFRRIMSTFENQAFLKEEFKTWKAPKGEKDIWYLTETEIFSVIETRTRKDELVWLLLGIQSGARESAFVNPIQPDMSLRPSFFVWEELQFKRYEQKEKKWVTAFMSPKVKDVVLRYVTEQKIDSDTPIFQGQGSTGEGYWKEKNDLMKKAKAMSVQRYYERLIRNWSKEANLVGKKTSTHIMKHTFGKQSASHGVAGDVAEVQAGTELRTLSGYYGFGDAVKHKAQMTGQAYEPEPFGKFMDRLADAVALKMTSLADGLKP